MDAIEGALKRLQQIDGVIDASLVGMPTGQVLGSVLAPDSGTAIVAGAAADMMRVVSLMSVLRGGDEDVEDVVVSLTDHHHVLRPLSGRDAEGIFLLVTFDRHRTNLALARRQLREAEADIVP